MQRKKLAIVIPAYKDVYLERTLSSLAAQTSMDFKVYVGDDASPFGIREIVDSFAGKLDLSYTRFDSNLGGRNLVDQWQRCLGLVGDEEWICLFSDDDIMGTRCVEAFMSQHIDDKYDVVHFNLSIIDENDRLVSKCNDFPDDLSSAEFYAKLFRKEITARMPEFVFRKTALELVQFDLAWRTDTATVMSVANPNGILTIPDTDGVRVLWRCSGSNISGQSEHIERKNAANLDFYRWTRTFFSKRGIKNPLSKFYDLKTFVFSLEFTDMRSFFSSGWKIAGEFPLTYKLLLCYRVLYWYVKESRYQ